MLNPTHQGTKADIMVSGETGPKITIKNVLWGNVLLCSGQVRNFV